jgi:hypothetical protein
VRTEGSGCWPWGLGSVSAFSCPATEDPNRFVAGSDCGLVPVEQHVWEP